MEIYIEYALAENFLLDGMLLWLALKSAKQKIVLWRIALSAALGAAFAVVFPLLGVGKIAAYALKFAAGVLMCLVAVKGKGAGRYALTALLFFGFSFALGGALLAAYGAFDVDYSLHNGYLTESAPVGLVIFGSFVFCVLVSCGVKRLYRRRSLRRFVYPCKVTLKGRTVTAEGFLDSGNRASVGGTPLCFLSPDLAFDLLGDTVMTEETTVLTVSGETKIKIFRADKLEIYSEGKTNIIEKIWFSPSNHIQGREYKIILGASVLD